jgi:hypothetical protein
MRIVFSWPTGTKIIIQTHQPMYVSILCSLECLIKLAVPLHNAGTVFDVVGEVASSGVHDIFYDASAGFLCWKKVSNLFCMKFDRQG